MDHETSSSIFCGESTHVSFPVISSYNIFQSFVVVIGYGEYNVGKYP